MQGKLITFEGIEGSGKTTQIRLLSGHLTERGVDHLVTREPGGTPLGDRIRHHLLDPTDPVPIDPDAELVLFVAIRIQHLKQIVLPALAAGRTVLCDRYVDATLAYQGYGRGLPVARIEALHAAAGIDRQPDLTLLFDLEVGPALARTRNRAGAGAQSRFDRESEAFHRRVREGYLRIAAAEPDRLRRIDAGRGIDAVAADVRAIVCDFLDLETAA